MPESAPPIPTALTELQAWPHWVVWRIEERDGKPSKVPYQATAPSRKASSTDPDTWATYEDARRTLERGRADGVGYVFAPDDEYCGVDLDKCVAAKNDSPFERALGPTIHPDARRLVETLNSYTELSPTGTGLHIIIRGRVNGSRNRTGKTPWGGEFENYDHARFFTITGEHLTGTPDTIEARQEQLDAVREQLFPASDAKQNGAGARQDAVSARGAGSALDDDAIIDKVRASKQGARFAELFDRGAGDGDASSADLALCNILAFWFGPSEARIDSVFRRSALMRDKWDDKRGDTTYGGYTIARALEGRAEFYGQNTPAAVARETEAKFVGAADELAAMCSLIDDPFVELWRSGRGTNYRHVARTRSGRVLDLNPLKVYTTAPRMNVEIASQLETEPSLQAKQMPRFISLLSRACELREEITADGHVHNVMTAWLQEAPEHPVVIDGDQAGRVQALRFVAEHDPIADARADGVSISRKAPVLVDRNTGERFVKQAWFNAYVKAQLGPGAMDGLGSRLRLLGWGWRGKRGRIKATLAGSQRVLFESFYTVPPGWEETE